jgi:very-short-patch-repair endonuclease
LADPRVKQLRIDMTNAERKLWSGLRDRRLAGFKFRRQRRIGPFIVDFVCMERRVIVEADGGQHANSAHDERRTVWLQQRGWRVVRFWNNEILENIDGVLQAIVAELTEKPSPSQASLGSLPLP